MDNETAQEYLEDFEQLVQNDWLLTALVAITILVLTVLLSHWAVRLIKKIIKKDKNDFLPSSSLFINITRGIIWFAGICVILSLCFNVNITGAIAALGVGGIALSLGLQDTISNLMGGLQVSLLKIVEPGDNIQIDAKTGVVTDINWRHTTMITSTGDKVIVPNSIINKQALLRTSPAEQVTLNFIVVSDGRDLEDIKASIIACCEASLKDTFSLTDTPRVLFTEITDNGFKGTLLFSITDASQVGIARDAALCAIAPLTRESVPS